jgi:hypothetical protein
MSSYNSIVFIEGIEHKRFIVSYLEILENLGDPYLVISFEDIKIDRKKFSKSSFKIIPKKDLINFCLNLEAKIFITTTPGIGNIYFPSSKAPLIKNRPKYIYVFHSLVSPNSVYSKNSFKNFDYIFSPNNVISDQLAFLTKKSNIFTTGYSLFSNSKEEVKKNTDTILIAPSWSKNGLFSDIKLLDKYIEYFITNKLNIVLRPHPMELDNLNNFNDFKDEKISIDTNKELNNLHSYEYLMTDWSGISLEYFYYTMKPVIFADTPKKIRRKLTTKEKRVLLIEDIVREKFGFILNIEKNNLSYEINKFNLDKSGKRFYDDIYKPIFNKNNVQKIIESLI